VNLTYLRPLYRQEGPWASAYLDASTDSADARKRIELAGRAVADELAAAGADPATRDAVEAAIRDHTGTGRHGLAVFAAQGTVALTHTLADPPVQPIGRWGPRPSVLPLLHGAGEEVRWLRVLVDRTGGDLVLDSGRTLRTVRGSDRYPIHKGQPGGWSQPRYQRAAEENWERNAKEVAEAIAHAVDEVGAEVVIVAGDVRARQLLVEHLPAAVAKRVTQTDAGSRAPGADPEPLDEATEEAVRALVAGRYQEVLDAYRAGRAHGLAVAGLSEVRTPLEWGQVETLLVGTELPDDPGDELVAAAVTEDAEVVLVAPDQEPVPEGVGAVLRFRVGPPEGAGDESAA
jgi:hypothetical protein